MLLLALGYGWYRFGTGPGNDTADSIAAAPEATDTQLAANPLTALQRSLDDAAGVNRALREQVLGLTQRVGLLEDGFAGMERGAAPGVDAVRLAEADFLLRLGEERLRLFGDVSGARISFELADDQLAEVSDPRATSVRQTLALERDTLAAITVADIPVILGRLDGLAADTDNWPLKGRQHASSDSKAPANAWWNRASTALDRYFRVRRTDPNERASGGPLLRERLQLDFSRARLLLLRGQGEAARAAIVSARAALQAHFDESDEHVAQALSIMGELLAAPLAPVLPTLGESRRELARLRGITLRTTTDNPVSSTSIDTADTEPPTTDAAVTAPVPAIDPEASIDDTERNRAEDAKSEAVSAAGDDAVPDDSDVPEQDH